jgi:outer membrane immunogenic protein
LADLLLNLWCRRHAEAGDIRCRANWFYWNTTFAADMAVKAPPAPPPAPVFSWTGFYAGGNIGASFGYAKNDLHDTPATVATSIGAFRTPGFGGSDTVHPGGFMGGGQIDYNWHFPPFGSRGLRPTFKALSRRRALLSALDNPFSFTLGPIPVTGSTVTD